jgi:hypothetical protein
MPVMRRLRTTSLVAVSLLLAGCNATFDVAAPALETQLYTTLYPYYVELCAVSQISKKPGFGVAISGGEGGHSVLYLNGVCRVQDAGYPAIALCDNPDRPSTHGVGLSVNAHFKNANWIATDGRDFFFRGGLAPGARLTRAAYERTQEEAKKKRLLDGVVFHASVFDDMPPGMSRRDYMYEVSIGTDYAIAFARDRYCARVPVSRAQMGKVVTYLNGLNAIYKDGKKDFEWNVLQNNCTHLVHNALAAAGLWPIWETGRFFLIAAFDFPVPKNEFVNAMWRTNNTDLGDIEALYRDNAARALLLDDGRLPDEPGALAEAVPVIHNNDVYNAHLRLIFYDDPIFGSYQRDFDTIFNQPRYTDVRANLRYFAALYARIKADRRPLADYLRDRSAADRADFAVFYRHYYGYIDRENAKVEAQLAELPQSAALGQVRP